MGSLPSKRGIRASVTGKASEVRAQLYYIMDHSTNSEEWRRRLKEMDNVNHPPHFGGADSVYEAKTCSQCGDARPLADFPPDMRRKDGCGSKCRGCVRSNQDSYYSRYPEAEAQRRKRNAEHGNRWHQQNRERQIVKMRWSRSKRLYGVTREDYEKLLESQGGRCAICHTESPGRKDNFFSIDHDHKTGTVRGLLCQRCNSGLGFFSDSPALMREAADYVERQRL